MEKDKAPKKIAVSRIVINSIRKLQGKDGVSLPALKKFLRDSKNIDTGVHDAEIKLGIKSAIDRGLLAKEGENYKVKAAGSKRTRSKRRSKSRSKPRRKRTTSQSRRKSRRRRSGGRKTSSRRKRSKRVAKVTAAADENM